jgi:hypothetical protein
MSIIEPSREYWIVGVLDCWSIGSLEYWILEEMECWDVLHSINPLIHQ